MKQRYTKLVCFLLFVMMVGFMVIAGNNAYADISVNTLTEIDTIAVGENPGWIALTPDGSRLYVVQGAGASPDYRGSVSVVDTLSSLVLDSIPLDPGFPSGIDITPNGTRAYLSICKASGGKTSTGANRVEVIDTSSNTIAHTIPINGSSDMGDLPIWS